MPRARHRRCARDVDAVVVYSNKILARSNEFRTNDDPLGLAIDLGSTTVAAFLVSLETGAVYAGASDEVADAMESYGRNLGMADHGAIVWDEIVPFWLVLLMTPDTLLWQLAAFLWFRFYDVVKPPPARWFDIRMKNGLGVMMDDVVAAAYTIFTLALFLALFERFA